MQTGCVSNNALNLNKPLIKWMTKSSIILETLSVEVVGVLYVLIYTKPIIIGVVQSLVLDLRTASTDYLNLEQIGCCQDLKLRTQLPLLSQSLGTQSINQLEYLVTVDN